MLKRLILAVLFSTGLSLAASAQDNTALAEKYIKLPALQGMLDSILGPGFLDPMLVAMGGGSLPPEKRELLVKIISEEISAIRPQMESAMIEAAAKTYTTAELDALIAFNSTPEGVSILGKLQDFNAAYLAGFGPAMQQMQSKIQQRVSAEIRP